MRRLWLISCVLALAGCPAADQEARSLTLATTTSTRDSGLLNVLVPMFEKETGTTVKVVAVGSGQALALGRRGDADVLLTHAPQAEEQFMAGGYGAERRRVMHNDFVLVGPESDPAHVAGQTSIRAAFEEIARSGARFVSRGDESGTHLKERAIWNETRIDPEGDWYVRAGTGMAEALRMAGQIEAYTLTDRGTFLAQQDRLDLKVLLEGDPSLRNPYAVIIVNSTRHPGVNRTAAIRFADFLLSPEVQAVIGRFGVEQFGQPLFFPHQPAG